MKRWIHASTNSKEILASTTYDKVPDSEFMNGKLYVVQTHQESRYSKYHGYDAKGNYSKSDSTSLRAYCDCRVTEDNVYECIDLAEDYLYSLIDSPKFKHYFDLLESQGYPSIFDCDWSVKAATIALYDSKGNYIFSFFTYDDPSVSAGTFSTSVGLSLLKSGVVSIDDPAITWNTKDAYEKYLRRSKGKTVIPAKSLDKIVKEFETNPSIIEDTYYDKCIKAIEDGLDGYSYESDRYGMTIFDEEGAEVCSVPNETIWEAELEALESSASWKEFHNNLASTIDGIARTI